MKKVNVVKIGGNVIDNPWELKRFLKDFSELEGPKILVHGGGREATRMSKLIGIETTMIEGRRVTDRETLDVVTMVYAGLINKKIVAELQSNGCNTVGLTGADGRLIPATRRPANPIDYGYVGDINPEEVNATFLEMLMEKGYVPVCCAICYDQNGGLLNCNADSVAGAVAIGMSTLYPTRLTYCFEKAGVMRDIEDEKTVIPEITSATFQKLREEEVIAAGMIPKLQNALECVAKGVAEVRICKAGAITGEGGTRVSL